MILGLEFPPIDNLVVWPGFFNKIALIYLISALVPIILFALAVRHSRPTPREEVCVELPHDALPRNRRKFLSGFGPHLSEACVGSISEVFDAQYPYIPRGCIAQAWSVAEVLRCWVKTTEETS